MKQLQKILIIDDDPEMLKLCEDALKDGGNVNIQVADSAKKAMELAQSSTPDLILLDILMPETSGITLHKQLRESANFKHIPIILITAWDEKQVSDYMKNASDPALIGVLYKPFSPQKLKEEVSKIWSSHNAA